MFPGNIFVYVFKTGSNGEYYPDEKLLIDRVSVLPAAARETSISYPLGAGAMIMDRGSILTCYV